MMAEQEATPVRGQIAGSFNRPLIPGRRSSKLAAVESIEELQMKMKGLSKTIKVSKHRLTRNGSYDAE